MSTPIVAGIDIGGTTIHAGFTDQNGQIIRRLEWLTAEYPEPHLLASSLAGELKKVAAEIPDSAWLGTGVGAPNGNFFRGTIEFAPNLRWKGIVPLADMITRETGLPCLLTNDANAGALGEMHFGAAKNMKDFLFITLGTGLGSGVVCGGSLVYGHDGFAGELGHVIVEPDGRPCGCGRNGCLETYCSASGLVKSYLEESLPHNPEGFGRHKNLSAKHIFDLAMEGDSDAIRAFDRFCKTLGVALANTVAITSPQAIFIFGGLAAAKDLIIPKTKHYMEENLLQIFRNKVEILNSGLPENDAAILGAASLIWDQLKKS